MLLALEKIREEFDLTKAQMWLLAGVPLVPCRKPFEIMNKAKEMDIFGDKVEHITWAIKDQALEALLEKGVLEKITTSPGATYVSATDAFFFLSAKALASIDPVCPQGKRAKPSYVFKNRQPYT
jgi:hypothetical protein